MLHYIIRRLLIGSITLLLITFIVYALIRHMPGTPLTMDPSMLDPSKTISEENRKLLEKAYGLDKPWYVAYFQWMSNVFRGDLGQSFRLKTPVIQVIGARVTATLLLSGTSLLLAYLLAIPLGIYTTARSGMLSERVISTILYMLYSIPTFVAGLLLLTLFYEKLAGTRWQLPSSGMESEKFTLFQHMILPVTCATYASLAYFARFVKSNMEEVVRQDYIRTARAKGAGPVRVLLVHAFRNTLIPLVTLVGLTLPSIVSGFVILESVFSWPGMGRLFLEMITFRDYPVIMGLTLMFSVLTLLGQLMADVLYAFVDPRVSYS